MDMKWYPVTRDDLYKLEVKNILEQILITLEKIDKKLDIILTPYETETPCALPEEEPEAKFTCPKCGKEFKTKQALGGHISKCKG